MKQKILVLGVLVVFVVPLVAFGAVFKAGDNPGVALGETLQDDLYIAGGNVLVAGAVTGDVYAGGGTIALSGPIGADLVAGGGTITLSGSVADDVRVGGGTVVLQGPVGGDVVAGGGQITIAGRVGGDVLVGGGMVRIESPVAGDVRVGGGEVYINAPIAGVVEADTDKLTLGPNAVISGPLKYRAPKEMVRNEGAQVLGAVDYQPRAERGEKGAKFVAGLLTLWFVLKTLMILALALVLGLLLKRFATTMVAHAARSPWLELGRGLMAVIVLPIASLILLATVVGIPLGILGLLSFAALMVIGCGLAAILMGSVIYRWFAKGEYAVNWKTILIGVAAYSVLSLIPLAGWLVQALFALAAIGAAVGIKWSLLKEWR